MYLPVGGIGGVELIGFLQNIAGLQQVSLVLIHTARKGCAHLGAIGQNRRITHQSQHFFQVVHIDISHVTAAEWRVRAELQTQSETFHFTPVLGQIGEIGCIGKRVIGREVAHVARYVIDVMHHRRGNTFLPGNRSGLDLRCQDGLLIRRQRTASRIAQDATTQQEGIKGLFGEVSRGGIACRTHITLGAVGGVGQVDFRTQVNGVLGILPPNTAKASEAPMFTGL